MFVCLGSGCHKDGCDGGSPRLKVLSVDGRSTWFMKVATHLTTFRLRGPIDLELVVLTEFFQRNASLESLEPTGLSVQKPSSPRREEAIELPNLKLLSICNKNRDVRCPSSTFLPLSACGVGEMSKVRAGGGDGRRMRRVERLHPKGSHQRGEAVWNKLWREAGL